MRRESRNTKFSSQFSSLPELFIIVTSFASSRALCADIQVFEISEYFSVFMFCPYVEVSRVAATSLPKSVWIAV